MVRQSELTRKLIADGLTPKPPPPRRSARALYLLAVAFTAAFMIAGALAPLLPVFAR